VSPADRESVRAVLDQSDTPDDALGRKLIAAASCAYYPPERPEIDICLACGFEGWGCICDPCAPREEPTPERLELARESRMMRAERKASA
jgi:hypothetical protein